VLAGTLANVRQDFGTRAVIRVLLASAQVHRIARSSFAPDRQIRGNTFLQANKRLQPRKTCKIGIIAGAGPSFWRFPEEVVSLL